jgi:hypothetical protein
MKCSTQKAENYWFDFGRRARKLYHAKGIEWAANTKSEAINVRIRKGWEAEDEKQRRKATANASKAA